ARRPGGAPTRRLHNVGWEQRRGRAYYYRPRKVGGRVVKEYVGAGPLGDLAAEEDAKQRADREQAARQLRAERDRIAALEDPTALLCEVAEALARGALLAAGYRRHDRGEWRRSRG